MEDRGRLAGLSLEPGWTWSGRMAGVDFVSIDAWAPRIRPMWYRPGPVLHACHFHEVDLSDVDLRSFGWTDSDGDDLRVHGGAVSQLHATGVRLHRARLREILFKDCEFVRCALTGLDASHVQFEGCRFEEVRVDGRARHLEIRGGEMQGLDLAELRMEFVTLGPPVRRGLVLPDGPAMYFVSAETWRREAQRLAPSLTAEGGARLQRELDKGPTRAELRSVSEGELRRSGWPERDARRMLEILADSRAHPALR